MCVLIEDFFLFFFAHIHFHPASGQAVVTGVIRSSPRFLPSLFIARRVQQAHCSSIFRRALLTHALAFSASQFVRKKKSPRIYTSIHSGGFELTKLNYTRLEDNLIRHRGEDIGRRLPLGTTVYLVPRSTLYTEGGINLWRPFFLQCGSVSLARASDPPVFLCAITPFRALKISPYTNFK